MNKRYIVRDKDGAYQSAYNFALGERNALDWATQCAKIVNGVVYLTEDGSNKEQEVYRTPDRK